MNNNLINSVSSVLTLYERALIVTMFPDLFNTGCNRSN